MNFCLEELDPTLVVEIEVGDLCSKIIQKSKQRNLLSLHGLISLAKRMGMPLKCWSRELITIFQLIAGKNSKLNTNNKLGFACVIFGFALEETSKNQKKYTELLKTIENLGHASRGFFSLLSRQRENQIDTPTQSAFFQLLTIFFSSLTQSIPEEIDKSIKKIREQNPEYTLQKAVVQFQFFKRLEYFSEGKPIIGKNNLSHLKEILIFGRSQKDFVLKWIVFHIFLSQTNYQLFISTEKGLCLSCMSLISKMINDLKRQVIVQLTLKRKGQISLESENALATMTRLNIFYDLFCLRMTFPEATEDIKEEIYEFAREVNENLPEKQISELRKNNFKNKKFCIFYVQLQRILTYFHPDKQPKEGIPPILSLLVSQNYLKDVGLLEEHLELVEKHKQRQILSKELQNINYEPKNQLKYCVLISFLFNYFPDEAFSLLGGLAQIEFLELTKTLIVNYWVTDARFLYFSLLQTINIFQKYHEKIIQSLSALEQPIHACIQIIQLAYSCLTKSPSKVFICRHCEKIRYFYYCRICRSPNIQLQCSSIGYRNLAIDQHKKFLFLAQKLKHMVFQKQVSKQIKDNIMVLLAF